MIRGDIVTVSVAGDYGKPRPAVVVQSNLVSGTGSVLVALVTSSERDAPIFRLPIEPSVENGLRTPSQVMVDKIFAVLRDKCGPVVGRLNAESIVSLDHRLSVVLGLVD